MVPAQPAIGIAAETVSQSIDVLVRPELRFRKQIRRGRTYLRGRVFTDSPRRDGELRLQKRRGGRFRTVATIRPSAKGIFLERMPAGTRGTFGIFYKSRDRTRLLDGRSASVRV